MMVFQPLPSEQKAIDAVLAKANAKYAFDMDKGDSSSRLDNPNELEYLRAEVNSFVLTTMMEYPALTGWTAGVDMSVSRYDPKYDPPSEKYKGTAVSFNIVLKPPVRVEQVLAVGEVK